MIGLNGNSPSDHLPFDEELCERYLFGELSESEQERFETAYFNDDSFFYRFLAVKDEILDLYSRNELDSEKRRRMEPHFLSNRSRKKRLADSIEFINSITLIGERAAPAAVVPPKPAEHKPFRVIVAARSIFKPFRFAAAMAMMFIVAASLWIIVERDSMENVADSTSQLPRPIDTASGSEGRLETPAADGNAQRTLQQNNDSNRTSMPSDERVAANADQANPQSNTLPALSSSPLPPSNQLVSSDAPATKHPDNVNKDVQALPPEVPKQPDVKPEIAGLHTETVTLDSASRSITSRNTAQIGTATRSVVIRMVFGGEAYSSYSVRVSGVGGSTIWRASNLKTGMNEGAKSLAVTVPAGSLTRKDYIVVLEGRAADGTNETIREYYLRVDRQ